MYFTPFSKIYSTVDLHFNPFQPSVVFDIETSHLICSANQIAGFYIKCNTALKWVNRIRNGRSGSVD